MPVKARKQPQRTCIACREVKPKKDLIRIVRSPEGKVFADPTGKANGRGAYICGREECLEEALKKNRLAKALEIEIDENTANSIREEFLALVERKRTAYTSKGAYGGD